MRMELGRVMRRGREERGKMVLMCFFVVKFFERIDEYLDVLLLDDGGLFMYRG